MHVFSRGQAAGIPEKEFPAMISGWSGTDVPYDKEVFSVLDPDWTIYKSYKKGNTPAVTLLILRYNTLEKADLSHSPIVCYTGQGWEIEGTTLRRIPIPGSSHIEVNQLLQKKLEMRSMTLFWYQSGTGAYDNRGEQKILLFWNKMLGRKDHNAFIRITVDIPVGKTVEDMASYLNDFVRDSYPEILKFVS